MAPLAAALILAATFAGAQTDSTFAKSLSDIQTTVKPAPGDLIDQLSASHDPQEQIALLDKISIQTGNLSDEDLGRMTSALKDLAFAPKTDSAVIIKSLDVLGKSVPWVQNPETAGKIAQVLIDAAGSEGASDSSAALRLGALTGLAPAAGHLPDTAAEDSVVGAALDALGKSPSFNEQLMARKTIFNDLNKSGPDVIYRSTELDIMGKFKTDYLIPLKNDLPSLYKQDLASRKIVMDSLWIVANYKGGEDTEKLHSTIREILSDMAQNEPDTLLKQTAHDYAESIPD